MISPLIYQLLSGRAFFLGIALLLLSVVGRWWADGKSWGAKVLAVICVAMTCLGAVLILFSSTPVPHWLYVATWLGCGAWLLVEYVGPIARWLERSKLLKELLKGKAKGQSKGKGKGNRKGRLHMIARGLVIFFLLLQVVIELPHHLTPNLAQLIPRSRALWKSGRPNPQRVIIVIGDSISAGISGANRPWPVRLGKLLKVEVINLAEAGATLDRAAKKQVPRLAKQSGLLILEIGGNDVLYRRPYDQFEASMKTLLQSVTRKDRDIIMFELPTLPFESEYASIQRRLAARHGIALIPKRRFIDVMNHRQATVDGIHLSDMGHDRMAAMMARLLSPPTD
jgi:lysophospholipase L1-like esterase